MQPVRIIGFLGFALALLGLVNGAVMLIVPSLWFEMTPGAAGTGPLNVHFIRDIGLAYFASSAALWLGIMRKDALLLVLSAIFSAGHAITHFVDHSTGHGAHGLTALLGEMVGIYLPALVAIVLGVVFMRNPKGA